MLFAKWWPVCPGGRWVKLILWQPADPRTQVVSHHYVINLVCPCEREITDTNYLWNLWQCSCPLTIIHDLLIISSYPTAINQLILNIFPLIFIKLPLIVRPLHYHDILSCYKGLLCGNLLKLTTSTLQHRQIDSIIKRACSLINKLYGSVFEAHDIDASWELCKSSNKWN